jgi:hypothetical protein
MTTLLFEKRLHSLPPTLTANTVYLVKTIDNLLEIYVSDGTGRYAVKQATGSGTGNGYKYTLVTTPKTTIINNRIQLPSIPEGDVVHNIMLVYDVNGIVTEYDSVTVSIVANESFAVLNENGDIISGQGVVSYLTRILT